MSQKPLYTTIESVKVRLEGKVRFQSDPAEVQEGELPDALLFQLISDSETDVELDLRGRYAVPFRAIRTQDFSGLPDHSKRAIRAIVDMKSVMAIIDTDFGRSGRIDGSNYYENTEKRYKEAIKKLLGQDAEAASSDQARFRRTPPLEGMQLAKGNTKADDGYRGMIINTDGRDTAATYAADQINDPSEVLIARRQSWSDL